MKRLIWLDSLRGIAIILMIIFHLTWDLVQFNYIELNIKSDFMLSFRVVIVGLFLFSVGISLQISYKIFNKFKFIKRVALLSIYSLLISIGSYIMYPNNWIYFGIIHMILISTFISVWFVNRKYLALIGSFVVTIPYIFYNINFMFIKEFFSQFIIHLPRVSYDMAPLFPYMGFVLFGIYVYNISKVQVFDIKKSKVTNILSYLGKHSMIIYLIHQPILFGVFLSLANG